VETDVTMAAGTAVVRLRGELDMSVRALLAERLAEIADLKPGRLVFDMAGVGYMDCGSAAVIFQAAQFLTDGAKPVIRSPRPIVRRLLKLTGLASDCDLDG
jgi:anti-anti-sigma factor